MVIKSRKAAGVIILSLFSVIDVANASAYIDAHEESVGFSKSIEKQEQFLWVDGVAQAENGWLSQDMLKLTDIASNAKKVPVPAALLLFGPALLGLLGVAGLRRKSDK